MFREDWRKKLKWNELEELRMTKRIKEKKTNRKSKRKKERKKERKKKERRKIERKKERRKKERKKERKSVVCLLSKLLKAFSCYLENKEINNKCCYIFLVWNVLKLYKRARQVKNCFKMAFFWVVAVTWIPLVLC